MTTATLQLAAAAHGTGEHRHPAQSRIQHCIQPCASSLCATPAMPSTMLNHVDKSSLHPLSGLQRVTSGAADGQPDLGLTPDQAQCTRHDSPHTPQCTRDDGFHTLLSVFWSFSFAYAVDHPTL